MIIAAEFKYWSWPDRERKRYFAVHRDGFVYMMINWKRPTEWIYPNDEKDKNTADHGPIVLYVYVKPKKGI